MKVLPFKVEKIAHDFGLECVKGEIDYNEYREAGHILTDEEIDYLQRDCYIVAKALRIQYDMGLTKMTIGSCAFNRYKTLLGKNEFKYKFPEQKDSELRPAYKGGYVYLKRQYASQTIGSGMVLDVNSLYPFVMRTKMLPYGNGIRFTGKYVYDDCYPIYIVNFECEFELKEEYLPTVQLKNNFRFNPTEYIEKSDGIEQLCMTNVDLELFLEHYNVYNVYYHYGYKFIDRKSVV